MSLSNNYGPINPKDFLSHRNSPYLYSESNNNYNNNFNSIYLPSNPNQSIQKTESNVNNYVKKSMNLDLSPSINNSLKEQTRETVSYLKPYSSFSNHNSCINKPNETNKKTLILDLDETLVHSAFTPFSRKSDLTLNINIEGKNRTLYVLKRPHVDEFLYELSSLYEIIIFTASISPYANPLLDLLDKNKCIKYRLYREHCTFSNGIYIKDLKIFERKINNMIIIDNNPLSYDNNIENGIPILSWYDDLDDNELLKLLPILKYMSSPNIPDVRNIINKIVDRRRNEIDYLAINKIINVIPDTKGKENNGLNYNLNVDNKYRKNYKSQEPRSTISNNTEIAKYENNYNFTNRNKTNKPLKNNQITNYNDKRNNKQLLNKKYNQIISYNYYNIEEEKNNNYNMNINIDKRDPNGTRISIFSPEEYNISNDRTLNYSYNTNNNNLKKNNNEEEKYNNRTMKSPRKYYDSLLNKYENKYNYNTLMNKKGNEIRSLTPSIENIKRTNSLLSSEDKLSLRNINNKFSLVELTKKALHLLDDNIQNNNDNKIENEYETIINNKENRTLYKFNNYFNKENEIIYNDYINRNKYLSNQKTINVFNKNSSNNRFFNNFNEETKNMNEFGINQYNNKQSSNNILLTSRRINSFNDRFMNNENLLYNYRKPLNGENNKNKLLERMNNEKINNFLNNNKANNKLYQKGNNLYNNYNVQNNNYIKNLNGINNNNYLNNLQTSLVNNIKSNVSKLNNKKENILQNNYLNYNKNENNDKIYNGRYEINNNNENIDTSNIISNHNSFSYPNNKKKSVKNLKKSYKTKGEEYNFHQLTRSSSYIDSSSEIEKFRNKFSSIENYTKKYYDDLYNIEYSKDLNYKQNNRPLFLMNNNKYIDTFKRTNYLNF